MISQWGGGGANDANSASGLRLREKKKTRKVLDEREIPRTAAEKSTQDGGGEGVLKARYNAT